LPQLESTFYPLQPARVTGSSPVSSTIILKSKKPTLPIDFYLLYSKQLPQLESTFYPLQPAPSHQFKPSIVHHNFKIKKNYITGIFLYFI